MVKRFVVMDSARVMKHMKIAQMIVTLLVSVMRDIL
jgi:hypothetical protein